MLSHEARSLMSSDFDHLFKSIVSGGWANEDSGNVEAPTNWFARVCIHADEANEVRDAFADDAIRPSGTVIRPEEIVGHFLVEIDNNGLVWVYSYTDHLHLSHDYSVKEAEYIEWDRENN